MSTRPDDQLVTLISHWLAHHVRDGELRAGIDEIGVDGLGPQQREAVEELVVELDRPRDPRGARARRLMRLGRRS
jgi:hypothetical protein